MSVSMVQFKEAIKDRIAKDMQNTANKIAAGQAPDYAAYKQLVGRVAGGKDALDAVDEVFKDFYGKEDE